MESTSNSDNKHKICGKKQNKFSLRKIRLSLKYRPDILKLVLTMRRTIKKKILLIKSLKHTLKMVIIELFWSSYKNITCELLLNNNLNRYFCRELVKHLQVLRLIKV